MKKIIAIIISVTLILSSFSAFASGADDIKAVLEIIKPRIMDTSGFSNFQSNENDYSGYKTYEFYWDNDTEPYEHLNISATKDGTIIHYYYSIGTKQTEKREDAFTLYTKEEIINKAQDLLNSLNPSMTDEKFKVENISFHNFGDRISFSVRRYYKDVLVKADTGNLTLDSELKNILSFRINYSDVKSFEEGEVVEKEDAYKAFKEKTPLKLYYSKETADENKKFVLKYKQTDVNKYISALNLEVVEAIVNAEIFGTNESLKDSVMSGGSGLTELEQAEINKISENYPSDKVLKSFYESQYFEKPENLELISTRLYKTSGGEYKYNFNFRGDNDYEAGLTVSAENGVIDNFYTFTKEQETSVNEELVREIHKALNPDFDKYVMDETGSFTRQINGVLVESDKVTICMNNSGKITKYSRTFNDYEYEPLDGIKSFDRISDIVFEKLPYKLMYVINDKDAKLVYGFDYGNISVKASTGEIEFLNENVEFSYNDIDNHYGKRYIDIVSNLNIGFDEESFKPDSQMAFSEFVQLLYLTRVSTASNTQILNSVALKNQAESFIKQIGIDDIGETVTREQSAILITKMLGLSHIADMDIFKTIYKDTTENLGHINIATKLGVFKGDENNCFKPYETLTRADGFIVFVNLLNVAEI